MTTKIKMFYQKNTKPLQIVIKYSFRNSSDEELLSFLQSHPVVKTTKADKEGIVNFSAYAKNNNDQDIQVMFINNFENALDDKSSKALVTKTINKLWKLIDGLEPSNLQREITDAEASAMLKA
jgi:hypothetical protein